MVNNDKVEITNELITYMKNSKLNLEQRQKVLNIVNSLKNDKHKNRFIKYYDLNGDMNQFKSFLEIAKEEKCTTSTIRMSILNVTGKLARKKENYIVIKQIVNECKEKMKNEKIRIVIADDMHILVKNMKEIVEKNPRVEMIETAYDGQDAEIKIMRINADLVFTDMQMPKKTGLEVIEDILCYPCVEKKPQFILVTSNTDFSLMEKSRNLGFDIVNKPIKEDTINYFIDNFQPRMIDYEAKEKEIQKDIKKARKDMYKNEFFRKNNKS